MSARPAAPRGLAPAGRALWSAVLSDLPATWEFDRRELAILDAACWQADTVKALERAVAADGVMIDRWCGRPASPERGGD